MKSQKIIILLEEYKELRDICEDYQKLLGEYKYLYHLYEQLTYCEDEECLEEKRQIGFQFKKIKEVSAMGIRTELERIKQAKEDIREGFATIDVDIPANATIDEYADYARAALVSRLVEEGYVEATDEDFTAAGSFRKYIGTDDKVIVPETIRGSRTTSCREMFKDTSVKGVAIIHEGVETMREMFRDASSPELELKYFNTASTTNMFFMFRNCAASVLDLSSFDLLGDTLMEDMFYQASTTTGYARTQADADRFNAVRNKPPGLTFVVK